MNVLVTAGNTFVPIDQVRGITNIFTGRTGASIALHAHKLGHRVTLLTSHPEATGPMTVSLEADRWTVRPYRTFADLEQLLLEEVSRPGLEAIIHCAAVSDYQAAGVYAPAAGTHFETADSRWSSDDDTPPRLTDRAAAKIKSDEPELWLRLTRTPKLVDRFRSDWGFGGMLVKFKLEVGISDERLLEVAEQSRRQSHADLMVANTLEGAGAWAYLGPVGGRYERLSRDKLPERLMRAITSLHEERYHG
jgi:phosphopantothenoylcysteine synthetase/decarboxylase